MHGNNIWNSISVEKFEMGLASIQRGVFSEHEDEPVLLNKRVEAVLILLVNKKHVDINDY